MAEAHEIYRQFCATPLRLKKKPKPSLLSSPSTDSNRSPQCFPRPELAPQSPLADAASVQKAIQTKAEVERLKTRIEVECRVDDVPQLKERMEAVPLRRTSARTRTTATEAAAVAIAPVISPFYTPPRATSVAQDKKKKRVTRAVILVNANTGGVCVDTPTRAMAPPKRSRKSTRQPQEILECQPVIASDICAEEDDKENIDIELMSITRNMMDAFADIDDALPDSVALEKPKILTKKGATRRKPAARQTKPGLRASTAKQLKPVQEPVRRSRRLRRGNVNPVTPQEEIVPVADARNVPKQVAMDIVEPIKVPPPSLAIDVEQVFCGPLLATKTTAGALFALWFNALGREVEECDNKDVDILVEVLHGVYAVCEGIGRCEALARAQANEEEDSDEEAFALDKLRNSTVRKAVRFRHFDLSSINLNYSYDKTVPGFVEDLLRPYVDVVDHAAALWDRRYHPAQADLITHFVGVLSNTDRLTERTKRDCLVSTAFRSMDAFEQNEVRASQPFFSREFAKLVPSAASTHPPFLEIVFSPLIASLARFRLRELFLPFDPKELLDEDDRLRIATYEHQDYGAAIHRALKEIHLYQDLAAPILTVIGKSLNPHTEAVKKTVGDYDLDDLMHVDRFMLACRYLRLSFRTCILLDSDEDKETTELRERFERLCTLMKRLRFEDEAHLFPLVSVEEFVRTLERREPSFVVLEKALETVGMTHHDAEAPCVECNEIVTRSQHAEAITCCSCGGRFHLSCLHLPLSFAQFAENYTCPFCFIGRVR